MKHLKKAALLAGVATAFAAGLSAWPLAIGNDQVEKKTAPATETLRQQTTKAQPTINREALKAVEVKPAGPPAFERSTAQTTKMQLTSENVYDFLVWAATSPRDQKEDVRAEIARRAGDEKISAKIQELYPSILKDDFDFALVALSVLGELRAKNSVEFFSGVLDQRYPRETVQADPGLTKRESIELLQSKAVEGLAYLGDETADKLVLKAAAGHPSRAVRSAAVRAYLYNAENPQAAREKLRDILKEDDLIFLDTISKGAMSSPEEFNKRLAEFYARHPDQKFEAPGDPQGPERADEPARPDKDETQTPAPGETKPR